jgi:hypothetical protein
MLDVEFLLGPPTRLERTLVYRYRSGVLRRPMKRALAAIAENEGNEVFGCLPGELCLRSGGVGLFSGINICDWSEKNDLSDKETTDALRWLAAVLSGDVDLPDIDTQRSEIADHQKRQRETYLDSDRYALEVDFRIYSRQLKADMHGAKASV